MNTELILTLAILFPFAASLIFFITVMSVEPRSLLSGISALCLTGGTGLSILLFLFRYSQQIMALPWLYTLLVAALLAIIAFLLTFPFLLAAFLIIEGIRLIKKEGLWLPNCLSLGLGIAIVVYFIILPMAATCMQEWAALASMIITWFSLQLGIFVLSAWVNRIHLKQTGYDQIVVLGSGLMKDQVTPLLAARIQKGIDLAKKNPKALLILSGGQGPDETIPEGEAMKKWALDHGADPARTIAETKSKNTQENLLYSSQFFPDRHSRTAIVTTGYHVFRALIFAKEQYIPAKGFGSKTKWYFSLNAILREYAAFVVHTRKKQIIGLVIFTFPAWAAILLNLIQ